MFSGAKRLGIALVFCAVSAGCATARQSSSPMLTPTPRDAECYALVGQVNGYWLFNVALAAPSNQPWVNQPGDCRYQVLTDATGYKSAQLDPAGCYGIDSSGSDILFRTDFCSAPPSATASPRHTRAPTPTPKPIACARTDQGGYVYNPDRLSVQAACIRVTGTVAAIRHEADGDLHILLALDSAYRHLLTPANQGEELGDLVIEPVCVRSVTQTDAIATCASDPDPMAGPFPAVGQHVWMEGRYVFDLQHGGWAELHPLYRWGAQ